MTRIDRYICTLLILGFGMIYVVLIPPFEAPDEPAHFARAYGIAEGQWILKDHPRQLIRYFVDEITARYAGQDIPFITSIQNILDQHPGRIPNVAYNSSQYSPVSYLLQAALIKILISLMKPASISLCLYACRGVSILFFSSLMFLIFKVSAKMAWPLFWIAMTPMALSQASVVNPDGLVFCAAAMVLVLAVQQVSLARYAVWMGAATFLLVSIKPPYAPVLLVPLAALYRNNRFRTPQTLWFAAAVILSLASMAIWSYFVKATGIYDLMMQVILKYNSPAIDPQRQLTLILHSPGHFFHMVVNTLSSRGSIMLHEFVGVLGWLNIPVPAWVVVFWCVLALPAILISERPEHISYPVSFQWGLCSIISALMSFLFVTIAVYMVWMPVGADFVYLQGRYFHPIAAALCVGLVLMKPFTVRWMPSRWPLAVFGLSSAAIHLTTFFILIKKFHDAALFG